MSNKAPLTPLQFLASLEPCGEDMEIREHNLTSIAHFFDQQISITEEDSELYDTAATGRHQARLALCAFYAVKRAHPFEESNEILNKLCVECDTLKRHISHFFFLADRPLLGQF